MSNAAPTPLPLLLLLRRPSHAVLGASALAVEPTLAARATSTLPARTTHALRRALTASTSAARPCLDRLAVEVGVYLKVALTTHVVLGTRTLRVTATCARAATVFRSAAPAFCIELSGG